MTSFKEDEQTVTLASSSICWCQRVGGANSSTNVSDHKREATQQLSFLLECWDVYTHGSACGANLKHHALSSDLNLKRNGDFHVKSNSLRGKQTNYVS